MAAATVQYAAPWYPVAVDATLFAFGDLLRAFIIFDIINAKGLPVCWHSNCGTARLQPSKNSRLKNQQSCGCQVAPRQRVLLTAVYIWALGRLSHI